MKKHLFLAVGIVAGLAVGAGGAIAATGSDGGKPDTETSTGGEAIGGASAPGARLAVMIDGNQFTAGPPADFVVNRSIGVQSVTNPVEGVFCIKPQPAAIPSNQLARIVPSVSLGYAGSDQYRAFAQYLFPRASQCPTGTISIRTFTEDFGGTLNTADNGVQFTVVVD